MELILEKILILKKTHFFSQLSEEYLRILSEKLKLISLPKNSILCKLNEDTLLIYFIRSGRVKIFNEETEELDYLTTHHCLGEYYFLVNEKIPYNAVCDTSCDFFILTRKDFETILEQNPNLAFRLSQILAQKIRKFDFKKEKKPTSKIVAIFSILNYEEKILLFTNLAIQTFIHSKDKILVVDFNFRDGDVVKFLKMKPILSTPEMLDESDLTDFDVLKKIISIHYSGVSFLVLPSELFNKTPNLIFPFLKILKEEYNIIFILLPDCWDECCWKIVSISDDFSIAVSESKINSFLKVKSIFEKESQKTFKTVFLRYSKSSIYEFDFIVPWSDNINLNFKIEENPLLSKQQLKTFRAIERLARYFSGYSIGLSLGSGAAFGYSIIGILKVLEQNEIFPDIIAGTSMGALVGAFYACGYSPDEMEQIALGITPQRIRKNIIKDFVFSKSGFLKGDSLLEFLKYHLGDKEFKDLEIKFVCVATDLYTGGEVVIKSGKIVDAVRASVSLPVIFQPVFKDDKFLVDGGLVNPVPNSLVASLGSKVTISVNLSAKPIKRQFTNLLPPWKKISQKKKPSIFNILTRIVYVMQYEIAMYKSTVSDVLIIPNTSDFIWSDFHKAKDIIKTGEKAAEEVIPKIKSLLPYFKDSII